MSTTPSSPATPSIDPISKPPVGRPVGHAGARVTVSERSAFAVDGFIAVFVALVLLGLLAQRIIGLATSHVDEPSPGDLTFIVTMILAAALVLSSVVVIQPGETKVVQFFGRYVGTARRSGLSMLLPLTTKRSVSVRVNNFETNVLKVNDADGNPVNIAAIIVWQVADTAKSQFAVENYEHFVQVQSEAALRHVATTHPYDNGEPGVETLRGSTDLVAQELADEVAARVAIAGVEIVEARISSLAYAQEIAQAMLQRQQAAALLAARAMIVEGAVSRVESALRRLESDNIVKMDEGRKAAMVSNLLVVLCGERSTQPVINTGSLY